VKQEPAGVEVVLFVVFAVRWLKVKTKKLGVAAGGGRAKGARVGT
jgi:hypothetical protein